MVSFAIRCAAMLFLHVEQNGSKVGSNEAGLVRIRLGRPFELCSEIGTKTWPQQATTQHLSRPEKQNNKEHAKEFLKAEFPK
eukprot:4968044-Amphidinium_carterae.1